jgi:hypothetical protein
MLSTLADMWGELTPIERANIQWTLVKTNIPAVIDLVSDGRTNVIQLVRGMKREHLLVLEHLAKSLLDGRVWPTRCPVGIEPDVHAMCACVQSVRKMNEATGDPSNAISLYILKCIYALDVDTARLLLDILLLRCPQLYNAVCNSMRASMFRLFVYDKHKQAENLCILVHHQAMRKNSILSDNTERQCRMLRRAIRHKQDSVAMIDQDRTLWDDQIPPYIADIVRLDAQFYNPRPDVLALDGFSASVIMAVALVHITDDATGHSAHLWVPSSMMDSVETLVTAGRLDTDDERLRKCLVTAGLAVIRDDTLVLREAVFTTPPTKIRLKFSS